MTTYPGGTTYWTTSQDGCCDLCGEEHCLKHGEWKMSQSSCSPRAGKNITASACLLYASETQRLLVLEDEVHYNAG